jgi:hypothetical protein
LVAYILSIIETVFKKLAYFGLCSFFYCSLLYLADRTNVIINVAMLKSFQNCSEFRTSEVHCNSLYVFFFNSHNGGWNPYWVHSACRPLVAYCTCPGWLWGWRIWWNKNWLGKPKYSEKTCPSATLSTTNSTWPDPGSNLGRCGEKLATNRLSYGAVNLLDVTTIVISNLFPYSKLLKYNYSVFCLFLFGCGYKLCVPFC